MLSRSQGLSTASISQDVVLLPVAIFEFTEGMLEQSQGKGKFQRTGGNHSHAIPQPWQLSFYPLNPSHPCVGNL